MRASQILCLVLIACGLPFAEGSRTAVISLSTAENDSEKIIVANVLQHTAKGPAPVVNVEISFFVSRLFGELPIVEPAPVTDNIGRARAVFPKNLPGDREGLVTAVAKIMDNDDYDDTEAKIQVPWGTPAVGRAALPRRLWAPQSPWPLLAVFAILIGGVWAVFMYVIIMLIKISRSTTADGSCCH
jgi:hypothetical protein